MLLIPFVVARRLTGSRIVLLACYETTPALVMLYGYANWRSGGGSALRPFELLAVTALFWAMYEFWKWSRKVGDVEYDPLGIGRSGLRALLMALLAIAALSAAALHAVAGFSGAFLAYGVALPLAFALWMRRRWTAGGTSEPARKSGTGWSGLVFVAALESAILLETAVS
jgi:hypothetical protein